MNHEKMLEDINKILENSFDFISDMECKSSLPNQKDFTQKEAKKMEGIIGSIYMIAHGTTCTTCGAKYVK